MQPLTHHEILALVEPFARRGRHVDLAASHRHERRLAFKPVEHPADGQGRPALLETLLLENPRAGMYRLTRVLALAGGPEARLVAEGAEPGALLARVESVSPDRQIRSAAGVVLARSHRAVPGADAGSTQLILTRGVVRVGGLALAMNVLDVKGTPGEIAVQPSGGGADLAQLPEDLLAVLGWSWSRLTRKEDGWTGGVRLARSEPDRSADAEHKLDQVAQHLARTLSEAPARFHDRLLGARWLVFLRRAFPLLASIGLIVGTLAIPRVDVDGDSVIRMLMFHSPPLLLIALFCMRELPRIEIPPLPRRPAANAWLSQDAPAAMAPDAHDLSAG